MRYSNSEFSGLTSLIYEGALRIDAWHEFAQELARVTKSDIGQVFLYHPTRAEFQFLSIHHRDKPALITDAFLKRYMEIQGDPAADPRIAQLMQDELWDQPVYLSRLVPRERVVSSPIYNEALAYCGVEHCLVTGVLDKESGSAIAIAVLRKPDDADFDDEDAALIGELIPHLRRARHMLLTLIDLTMQADAGFAILESQPSGIVVLARDAEVIYANSEAQVVIASSPTLSHKGRHLIAAGKDAVDFSRALHRLYDASLKGERAVPEVLLFGRGEGRKPLRMVLAPISPLPVTQGIVLKDRHYVAMLLIDPERPVETNVELLQRLFGLTKAEAAVVAGLLRHHDLKETAADLDISYNTARTHLQRVFEKTETTKQSELIALALDMPMRRRVRVGDNLAKSVD